METSLKQLDDGDFISGSEYKNMGPSARFNKKA